jgi:hypothetical protein
VIRWYTAAAVLLVAATPAHAVELVAQPDLAEDVDALPRLVGSDDVAALINAEFDRVDLEAKTASAKLRNVSGSWYERAVIVSFSGPRYLVIEESGAFAEDGASHPSSWQVFHSFDLATGAPILWGTLLPPVFVAEDTSLQMDALRERYRRDVIATGVPDCVEVLQDAGTLEWMTFDFSLDAAAQALVLWPLAFPYSQTACANPAMIGVEELRALGANPDLVSALEAAAP